MKINFKKYLKNEWKSIPDIIQMIHTMNIKRISFVAIGLIIFELINLINKIFNEHLYVIIGIIVLCLINIIYVIITQTLHKQILSNKVLTKVAFLSYWIFIIISMSPFLIYDIMYKSNTPLNITLLCALLIVIPIFERLELFVIFLSLLSFNIILMVIYEAPINFIIYVIVIILASLFVSNFVQYQYIHMIVQLNFEVRVDYLTGIMNVRGGMDKVQTILELTKRQNTSIVLYMIDIDYFKSYNDKYGHLYGDTVLKSVAKAISTTFTRISDVVCRYGGEEFLVCSVIKNSHEAEMMANQIQKNIRNLNIDAPNKTISPYLTVSVGYVVYNAQFDDYKSDTNINTLLGIADTALYKAKNSGRNKVESYIMPLINP